MFLNYCIGFVICSVCTYYAYHYLGAYAVVVAVLWGALLAKPILESVVAYYHFCRDAPLKPYQGNYYAFDGYQVRVFEINYRLWVADNDVLVILGLSAGESSRILASPSEHRWIENEKVWAYSERAALRLVHDSLHPLAPRLKLWLQREIYLPYHRK